MGHRAKGREHRAWGIEQRAKAGEMAKFRFQDLEIWKEAIEIGNILFDKADKLEVKKLFRFAEQLRGAGMSISNNIAEGSGSHSKSSKKPSLQNEPFELRFSYLNNDVNM
jgi:hypothetical protein